MSVGVDGDPVKEPLDGANGALSMSPMSNAAANDFAPQFSHNQIVRGRNFGVFVVLGTRLVDGALRYIVKEINPANLTETAPGEMQFTADMLRPYY